MILARGTDKPGLQAIMARDPSVREDAAGFEVIEFMPSQTRAGFKPFTQGGKFLRRPEFGKGTLNAGSIK